MSYIHYYLLHSFSILAFVFYICLVEISVQISKESYFFNLASYTESNPLPHPKSKIELALFT